MDGEFPFGEKRGALGVAPEPIIRIPVLTILGYQNFDFLVDTGADCSIMPASVVKDLPLDLEDCALIKFRGIGGESFDTRIGKFTAKIMDKPVAIACAFAPRENTPFILGRKDIFSMFSLLFDNARKFVKFIPIK